MKVKNLLYLQERRLYINTLTIKTITKLGILAIIINKNVEEFLKVISFKLQFLSIAQDLCQAHYQTLLIILLKEFIKLNLNVDMTIRKM